MDTVGMLSWGADEPWDSGRTHGGGEPAQGDSHHVERRAGAVEAWHVRRSRRTAGLGVSPFSSFGAMAADSSAVNLGQGIPDFGCPAELAAAAVHAVKAGDNSYSSSRGDPELRRAIAEHAMRFYGHEVDPDTMVSVTAGAGEALLATVLALVDPGDEVVVFEPFFPAFHALITLAGGILRPVRLNPPDAAHSTWWFDRKELEQACTPRTAAFIVNSPHNPTGKVFTRDELESIADLATRYQAYVISDECYEHVLLPPSRHIRTATVSGLSERTITIGSASKTFHVTGWRVGWLVAPTAIAAAAQSVHEHSVFAAPTPFQKGVAVGLRLPDRYFEQLAAAYALRHEALGRALERGGIPTFRSEGTFFQIADVRCFGFPDDVSFCRHLTSEIGVAALPVSAFKMPTTTPQTQVRFCFCKDLEVFARAAERLAKLRAVDR